MLLIPAMHPHHHYADPPYTQDESISDVSSDFPPIKVRESSPSPPVRSVSQSCQYFLTVQEQLEQPSQSQSAPQSPRLSRRLNKGKGVEHKNVDKTIEATLRDAKVRNQTLQIFCLLTIQEQPSQSAPQWVLQSSRHSRRLNKRPEHRNLHKKVEASVGDAKVRNQTL